MAPLALCAACSLVYDVDNLPGRSDARVFDAAIDAPVDADPSMLALTSVEPASLLEGTGTGGRPALLVLHGASIVDTAEVSVAFVDAVGVDAGVDAGAEQPMLAGFGATADGTLAGVAVRIPVIGDLHAGENRTLRVTLTQGAAQESVDVTVAGLEELTLAGPTAVSAATATPYSQIEITGKVHFTGADPVRLFATGGIHLAADLDGDAVGQEGGPHGCRGADQQGAGGCTPGGGAAGGDAGVLGLTHGAGGGGGGFGAPGTAGNGTGGGKEGMATGVETLVPIVSTAGTAGNRGNGGGGGGQGTLNAAGGAGGGGGGVIYLAAGGDITVDSGHTISAKGATASGGSGGGGGGSGGAILIRAGGAITSTGAWLTAPGGLATTGSQGPGGPGGVGRIRVDAAVGNVVAMATTPGAFRGPSWAAATPSIATTAPTLTLVGQPGRAFGVRLNDQAQADVTPGVDGTVAVTGLALRAGRNQICAVAQPGALVEESLSCVELFVASP